MVAVRRLLALVVLLLPAAGNAQLVRGVIQNPRILSVHIDPNAIRRVPKFDTGPLTLQIIDRGLAEADDDGTRTVMIGACLEGGATGKPDVAGMFYELQLPGGTRKGEMQAFFQPFKLATVNDPGHAGADVRNCRRATLTFSTCAVPPGKYPLKVTATAPGDATEHSDTDTTLFAPYPTPVTISAPGDWEVGAPSPTS